MNPAEIKTSQRCPDAELWVLFAAGICPEEEQERLLDHVLVCGACASRLRDLTDAVSEDQEPLDARAEADIDTLADRLDNRRHKLSQSISRKSVSPFPYRRWMLAVAAGLIVVAGVTWLFLARGRGQPPLELLAAAYTSRRTMELQIPGAAYSPLQISRGGDALADAPPALLESQLEIKRHLESKPEDAGWLHAQARAQLLLWQFDAALTSFQAAADLGADSSDFLIDYASAYYQRAERTAAAVDYARALEKLGQALRAWPDDPAALFNRGIVYSKLHQYSSSIDDFEHCLRVQIDPQWKKEAETRLREARRLIGKLFDRHRPPTREFQAEHDLEDAMVSGLAEYFHQAAGNVRQTASAMVEEHQDPWLSQVIRLAPTPETLRAVEILSRLATLRVTLSPDYDRMASEVQSLASTPLPLPLRVWRDFELLYRDTRTSAVATCAPRTDPLLREAVSYPWFESQMLLESSLCSAAAQDFAHAGLLVDRAQQIMKAKKLAQASIRVLNFQGQRLVETGYFRDALQIASDGLAQFDKGSYPPRRAYDFHAIVMLVAVQMNLPNTGYGASRMMAAIGESNGLPLFQMLGRCREAGFALSLGLRLEAGAALRSAEAAVKQLGDTATARTYWRTSRIAWLESEGDLQTLNHMLDEARETPTKSESLYFDRNLVVALCRLEARMGHRARVEEIAERFWKDTAGIYASLPAGELRAFRPELESVSKSLTAVRLRDDDQIGALEAWQRFLAFDERLLGAREAGNALQSAPIEQAILTVADLGEKGAVWFQHGGYVRFHWTSQSCSELTRQVRKLRRLCSLGASSREISFVARALYRSLFPEGVGTASHVIVRTRGPLNMLPLATFSLLDEGRNTVFSFLPLGGKTGAVMVSRVNATRMTVVAATSFDPARGFPALPDAEIQQEISAVGRAFPETVVIRGAAATARAMEVAAGNSQALHFTGHAAPWRGSIGLLVSPDSSDASPDGRAGVWGMGRPRSVNAGLVVLSACSTGAFEDPATVESGQLAISMLLAGAGQVVASLWDVDFSATTAWNRAFYEYLAQGRPTSDAIKLASDKLRTATEWRSPRYWAGFALYEQ